MYAQSFRVNTAFAGASLPNNYTEDDVQTMIPISIIFSTIDFYYECSKPGRKKREREWSGRQL